MTLEPLLPLFHRLDRQHFNGSLCPDGQALVELRWSDRRMVRSAGLYRHGRRRDGSRLSEIVLSRPLLAPLPRSATLGTLCHEMIHAWIHRVLEEREVHGPRFRARMAAINAAQDAFEVSLRHNYPLPPARQGWIASCPCCGVAVPYRQRRQGLACRACCQLHHGGRWHPACQLVFERRSA